MDQKKISITLSTKLLKHLEDGNYNKSKLIDSLLSKHFKKESEKKSK